MKKYLLSFVAAIMSLSAMAAYTTDPDGNVTDDYIKNYSFDVESDWVTSGNVTVNPLDARNIPDWTCAGGESWNGSAVLKIGSEATINNAKVPALNAAGAAEGGAFACATSWGQHTQYTQEVTLPAGTYILSFDAYEGNTNVKASGIAKYLIGFIAADGTEYLAKTETYNVEEWTNHEVKFTLLEETTGKWSIGYSSNSVTSNDTPKLFIDNLKLMKGEIEYPVDLTGKAINRHNGWTKLASVGSINNYSTDYAEFYNAQHLTGDVMQQIVNVPNGKYNVEVYFNANCADWECTPVDAAQGQIGYSVMYINDQTINTPIKNNKSLTAEQPYSYNVNLNVENGNLAFKVENLQEAANWITVSIHKIELVSKPYSITSDIEGNGTVENPTTAYAGDILKFKATPDEGYVVATISINGTVANLAPDAEGYYSITMPEENVTIEVVFEEEQPEVENYMLIKDGEGNVLHTIPVTKDVQIKWKKGSEINK